MVFFLAIWPVFKGTSASAEETAPPEIIVDASTAPADAALPDWLVRAKKYHAEGAKARAAGDIRAARRGFSRALGQVADRADEGILLGLEERVGDLLSDIEQELSPPIVVDEGPISEPTLAVSERELAAASTQPVTAASPARYTLPVDPENPLVKKFIALYTGPYRANLQATFNRMASHKDMILRKLDKAGLPRELLYLPLIESEYQIRAVSRAGAVGLWQFMGATGRSSGLKINYWVDERIDPEKSTDAALRHLKELYDWFDDWPLALAAYNRGSAGVHRDMQFSRSTGFEDLSKAKALPDETEKYVPKLYAVILLGDNAADHGFTIPPSQIGPDSDAISLPKPLDLKVAAACAGVPEDNIRALNPTLRLWCTPKNETAFQLKIPRGSLSRVRSCLDNTKDWTPAADVIKHRVKNGEYLGRIASRYRTSVQAIQRDNRITNPKRLRPGQILVIRPGRGYRGD